jgi:hypothetical protein
MSSRDYTKYVYLTIALAKNGPTHQALLRDAKEVDTKQYPTVAALRLKDYYAGVLRNVQAITGEQGNSPAQLHGQEAPHVITKDATTAETNADAALDEWE